MTEHDAQPSILFLTHYFPPEGNAPASRVHEMCKRWVARGHRVTVVTGVPNVPDGKVYEGYENRWVQRETIDGIEVVRVWTFIAANKGTVLRMVNYISYMFSAVLRVPFLEKPTIIIATSPQLFCGWAGVLARWLRRRPLILEMRDQWAESIVTLTGVKRGRLYRLFEWFEFTMYRLSGCVVTVGEGYRRELIAGGVDPDRIHIITNGVDRELFAPRERDLGLERSLGLEGKFVCSYIGTIGLACGLDVVLRAARKLQSEGRDDVVFLLVGEGAMREELESEARRDGLANVIFAGKRPKAEIPAFLSISHCSLIHLRDAPLYRTVLPSKIFEAAHMKRPIVLGVAGEAARVVEATGGGLCIDPGDEDQLIGAIDRLAGDPGLAERLGRSGHDYVAQHFDRDRLALDYLDLIRNEIRGHNS